MRVVKIAFGLLLIFGGLNALSLKQIDRNLEKFEAGCTRSCNEDSGHALCASFCSCLLAELKAQHPSKRELAAYLTAAEGRVRSEGTVMDEPEFLSLAKQCVERVKR